MKLSIFYEIDNFGLSDSMHLRIEKFTKISTELSVVYHVVGNILIVKIDGLPCSGFS